MNHKEMVEKHGWVVHYVYETDKREFNGLCNTHTHGMKENFNHLDLQVVLPLGEDTIYPVLSAIVGDIKAGVVYEPNKRYATVLRGMDVIFKEYQEGDRTVLRLLIPDANGKLPGEEGCDPTYNRQLENIEDDESEYGVH